MGRSIYDMVDDDSLHEAGNFIQELKDDTKRYDPKHIEAAKQIRLGRIVRMIEELAEDYHAHPDRATRLYVASGEVGQALVRRMWNIRQEEKNV